MEPTEPTPPSCFKVFIFPCIVNGCFVKGVDYSGIQTCANQVVDNFTFLESKTVKRIVTLFNFMTLAFDREKLLSGDLLGFFALLRLEVSQLR